MKRQPRPVKFRTTIEVIKKRPFLPIAGFVMLGFGIFFLLFMAMIASLSKGDDAPVDYETIMASGQTARGTVIGVQTQRNITINNEHPSIIWYSYIVEGDTITDKFKTLAQDQVSRMDVGDEVPVKHLNGQSIITSLKPLKFPPALYAIGGACVLVAIVLWAIALMLAAKETRLYKIGVIEKAEVVAVTAKSGRPVNKYTKSLKVHYQYLAGNPRKKYVGQSIVTDAALVPVLKTTPQVKVFVLPYKPSQSIIIPHLEAIRNNWQIDN